MKETWKCVNEVLGRSPSIQGKNIFERHMETTMKEIAEKFCETFACAVSPGEHICQEQLYYDYMKRSGLRCQHIQRESIYIPDITEQELRSMIATMDKKKSPGYDNIMLADVIGTLDSISPALVRLINLSLRNAVIPSLLKVAVVTPIYKNGKKDAYTNYRPISVLSCIDKIIEKYVAKVMHDYLQKYQILNESQYGYRKNRGTIDLLERVADIVNGKLNEHKHVLCLFIDFSKAFDRINHDKLLKILEDLGIRGPLLDWFRCFLANRRFCVKVGNEVSSLRELRAGVPQGSILGPLLYLLYVNDVQHCFQDCRCFLYADDTLILAVHKDIKKAEQMLLREFHRFQLWAHQKDLLINTSKTKLMHVASPHSGVDCDLKLTVHDTDCLHMEDTNHNRNCECDNIIELVHRQKYLGIYIDSRFLWDVHIGEIGKKLSYFANCFYYLSDFVPRNVLRIIYHSLVESVLSYGITIWGQASISHINRLKSAQGRILRNMDRSVIGNIYGKHNILSINHLYIFRVVINNYFKSRDLTTVHHPHATRARERGMYVVPKTNNKYGDRLISVQLPKILNDLPEAMLNLQSLAQVKANLRSWLVSLEDEIK
ncbi:hypothetical protein Trydic_g15651 [Trypoxylus dichotomus]